MSRIGRLPVEIPDKVKVEVKNSAIKVEGPKGKMEKTFAPVVVIEVADNQINVTTKGRGRFVRAMHGTTRSIVANMVQGVTQGYSKNLEVRGVGFRASVQGNNLDMQLGYSHPIRYEIPQGITVTVADNTKIKVEGVDKQLVGEVAAEIKHFHKPEPYKGKGVHIIGEPFRKKEGKKAG